MLTAIVGLANSIMLINVNANRWCRDVVNINTDDAVTFD